MYAQSWEQDDLGDNYFNKEIWFPDDYSGKVKATVVKQTCNFQTRKAVLYVHGYNDYFFQKELGDKFVNNGYNFYAIDLRKYGRSLMSGQTPFEVRDLKEYFADINAAIDIILEDGNSAIVLMGHSTGGLITSYYLAETNYKRFPIRALILNSPFMDMNLDCVTEDYLLPFIKVCARVIPDISIKQGGGNMYARTLLDCYEGEWNYNLQWKFEWPQAVSAGWLNAISQAQDRLHRGADIDIPILLMHSDRSFNEQVVTISDAMCSDIVLDVKEISIYGKRLGSDITEFIVKNGMHDLFLSSIPVRYSLYSHVFEWLRAKDL